MTNGTHITAAVCEQMRDRHDDGQFAKAIAEEFDVSRPTVYYHVRGKCTHTQ